MTGVGVVDDDVDDQKSRKKKGEGVLNEEEGGQTKKANKAKIRRK